MTDQHTAYTQMPEFDGIYLDDAFLLEVCDARPAPLTLEDWEAEIEEESEVAAPGGPPGTTPSF